MNVNKYLQRIGSEQTNFVPNLETLKFLQRQHLLNIPFENLDIHWKIPIVLDSKSFYKKIVEENRGGFCYELNGLFYELLEKIGFRSEIISGRVINDKGNLSAEFDHLAILTEIDGEKHLVDVGFGNFTAAPLKLALNIEQNDETGIFLIKKFDKNHFEITKKDGSKWKSEYIFTTLPRNLAEFTEMCKFHQTSPDSHFTKGKVCSLMTDEGRKTLTDKKFIETKNSKKKEIDVASNKEFYKILEREFQIKPKFSETIPAVI